MLITRPRSSSGTFSCTSDAVSEKTTSSAPPARNSSRKLSGVTGRSANAATSPPNAASTRSSVRPIPSKLPSQATTSAPATAPAPSAVIIRLSVAGSPANTGRKARNGRPSDVVEMASTVSARSAPPLPT